MPFVDGDLAGEDGRAAPVALLEDFVEVTTRACVERFEAPIVEDQELDAGKAAQDPGIAAIAAGERELGEELGDPLVENRAGVTTSLMTERTGKPTFADPGRPAQDQIVVRLDPVAGKAQHPPHLLNGEVWENVGACDFLRDAILGVVEDALNQDAGSLHHPYAPPQRSG